MTPDGRTLYVVDMGLLGGSGKSSFAIDAYDILPIDVATGRPGKPIDVGPGPGAIALAPDGATAYVVDSGTPVHPVAYMVAVNLATGATGPPIATGAGPRGGPMAIAITPDGRWIYVANAGWPEFPGDTVLPINTSTGRPGRLIRVGSAPLWIAITPNGKWAYVANSGWGFAGGRTGNRNGGFTVTPIDLSTNVAGVPITVGPAPSVVAITPDGKWAYVADTGTATRAGDVTPINIARNCAGVPMHIGESPDGIAIALEPPAIVKRLVG